MKWNLINQSRKGWVDALRGLAILLVVYGHCVKNMPAFFIFTSPFKMPLFFAISGYVLIIRKGDRVQAFINQLFKKVFIPWMVLGLLPSAVMIPFKGFHNLLDSFLALLSGQELWFMPCFFIAEIIWYILLRGCKRPLGIAIAAFVCFLLGLILHRNGLMNYAMFNRALVVQPFFLIGYLFQQYENRLIKTRWCWIGFVVVLYIGLCFLSMVLFPGKSMDVHLNQYYNIPYCLLLIFLSCFILFTVACKADFHSSIMSFIGQNTLVIYIWHGLAITVLVKAVSMLGWNVPTNAWTAIIKVIWACIACGLCAVLLNNLLPEVVGKRRNRSKNDDKQSK